MPRRYYLVIFLVPIAIMVFVAVFLLTVQRGGDVEPTVGLTAAATLQSPDGNAMGTVTFRQAATGVLVMADVKGLAPGGHAFIIHEIGSCTPDFDAAGDHFNPEETEHGLIHPTWKRGELTAGHGGDLPNIYAASDGSARADFFTEGVILDDGPRHSLFDEDGSAIIVHEKPDPYGAEESETGDRVACGVIQRT